MRARAVNCNTPSLVPLTVRDGSGHTPPPSTDHRQTGWSVGGHITPLYHRADRRWSHNTPLSQGRLSVVT